MSILIVLTVHLIIVPPILLGHSTVYSPRKLLPYPPPANYSHKSAPLDNAKVLVGDKPVLPDPVGNTIFIYAVFTTHLYISTNLYAIRQRQSLFGFQFTTTFKRQAYSNCRYNFS
jgi:hypothetical protein